MTNLQTYWPSEALRSLRDEDSSSGRLENSFLSLLLPNQFPTFPILYNIICKYFATVLGENMPALIEQLPNKNCPK
jgi:hypothetical protein